MRFMMPSRRDDSETLCILFFIFFLPCVAVYMHACVCINTSDKHMEDSCYTHLLFHKQMNWKCQFSVTHQALIIGKSTCLPASTSYCIPLSASLFFPPLMTPSFFFVCVCVFLFLFSDWRVTQKLPAPPPPLLSHMTKKLLGRSFHLTLDCQIIIS